MLLRLQKVLAQAGCAELKCLRPQNVELAGESLGTQAGPALWAPAGYRAAEMESKGLTERTRGWGGPRMQVTPPANCCLANGFQLDFKPRTLPVPSVLRPVPWLGGLCLWPQGRSPGLLVFSAFDTIID